MLQIHIQVIASFFLDWSPTWPLWLWLCSIRDDKCHYRRYCWFIAYCNTNIRPHVVTALLISSSIPPRKQSERLDTLLRSKNQTRNIKTGVTIVIYLPHAKQLQYLIPLCYRHQFSCRAAINNMATYLLRESHSLLLAAGFRLGCLWRFRLKSTA